MKQNINEIKKMQRLAGLITESEYQESLLKEMDDESALNLLISSIPHSDLYNTDYNTWESAMFISYEDLDDLDDISLSKEEYDKVHNDLKDNDLAYFVRNFTVQDGEEQRHEEELEKDVEYFKTQYAVNDEQAKAMKYLVDSHIV